MFPRSKMTFLSILVMADNIAKVLLYTCKKGGDNSLTCIALGESQWLGKIFFLNVPFSAFIRSIQDDYGPFINILSKTPVTLMLPLAFGPYPLPFPMIGKLHSFFWPKLEIKRTMKQWKVRNRKGKITHDIHNQQLKDIFMYIFSLSSENHFSYIFLPHFLQIYITSQTA